MKTDNQSTDVLFTLLGYSNCPIMANGLELELKQRYTDHEKRLKELEAQVVSWENGKFTSPPAIYMDMDTFQLMINTNRSCAISLIGEESLLRASTKPTDLNSIFLAGPRQYPVGYFERHLQYYRTVITDLQNLYNRLGVFATVMQGIKNG